MANEVRGGAFEPHSKKIKLRTSRLHTSSEQNSRDGSDSPEHRRQIQNYEDEHLNMTLTINQHNQSLAL